MRKSIDLAAAVAAAEHHQAQALTLEELARAYCATTLDDSDLRLKKWLAAFGSKSAWEITAAELATAAQAMIDAGYKPATPNRDLSVLGSMYRWAIAKRLCPRGFRSPTLDVPRGEEGVRRVEVSREQVEALRARARVHRDRRFGVFVELLFDTGARKSEVLMRRWAEVDLERREILCEQTKTGVPRVLHFREETAGLMKRVYSRRDPQALLFEGYVPGRPIDFKKAWMSTVEDVGLKGLHVHDVRHVAAARLLRSGVTLGVAAQVLGHSSQVLSRRYGHLETGALRQAQERAWEAST